MMLKELKKDLNSRASKEKAAFLPKFFKTKKGEYAEGDRFLGVTVPNQRKIAKKYKEILLEELQQLMSSKYHEHRLTALFILVLKYQKSNSKEYVDFYLKNLDHVNNWDLVDSSAPYILGHYLANKDKTLLYEFVSSDNFWKRRIAMVSCYYFIKNNDYEDALEIAQLLLFDDIDLIHKAVGWMLREIGNRDLNIEEMFLKKHYKNMPRTMLRYSIEKFSKEKKEFYMKK